MKSPWRETLVFSLDRNEVFCTLCKLTRECPFGGWSEGPRKNFNHNTLVSILRPGLLVWRKGCCLKAEVGALALKNVNTDRSSPLQSSLDKLGHPLPHQHARAGIRFHRAGLVTGLCEVAPFQQIPAAPLPGLLSAHLPFTLEREPTSLEEGACYCLPRQGLPRLHFLEVRPCSVLSGWVAPGVSCMWGALS